MSRRTAPLRLARAFHGAWLDAFVYAEAAFTVIDPELLAPARILVDHRGFAKALLERIERTSIERAHRRCPKTDAMVRVWYAKMFGRIAAAIWSRGS